jgi:methylated-DNA-[protein]-cysteine S-methyltransferase
VYATLESPIGPLTVVGRPGRLSRILFPEGGRAAPPPPDAVADDAPLAAAIRQLEEYFCGERASFDLELAPQGTAFQKRVWEELLTIPFGETRSYGQIAEAIGWPDAARAVGAANGRNPIPIVIPCHRVLGASGALTGFGGGLDTKRWLLRHERQRTLFVG